MSADVRTVAVVGASGLGGGSNWFDLGFALDPDSSRLVVMGALDSLVKGGAGHGLQAVNLALGWPEDAGLGFAGHCP